MVIQHNLQAQNSNRQLTIITGGKAKATEKLSSGYKVNRAADDAAGLSISEKMRWQIRGLDKASSNAQDGISLIQTAEGALNEVHFILERMKELSVQAANDTNTSVDRDQIQQEINQLSCEVDRVASTTQFNTMNLLDGSLAEKKDGLTSPQKFGEVTISFELIGLNGKIDSVSETSGISPNSFSAEEQALADFIKDRAYNVVGELYHMYPDLFSNAASDGVQVGLSFSDSDGTGGKLATASLSTSYNSQMTEMIYRINVDPQDYPASGFSTMSDEKKAKLAATVAHEMTHVVMYDTLTNGMINNKYPKWFIEGMAQATGGDGGWLSNHLSTSSTDIAVSNYLKNSEYRDYGAGYVASVYLGYRAGEQWKTDPDALGGGHIKDGMKKIFADLSSGKSLNDVIKEYTPYQGVSDFEEHFFNNPDSDVIRFTHMLRDRIGEDGCGSVINMGMSSTAVGNFLGNMEIKGTNYTIVPGYQKIKNIFGAKVDLTYGGVGEDTGGISGGTNGIVPGRGGLNLQVGALSGQKITIYIDAMNSASLNIRDMKVDSFLHAGDAIKRVDLAIDQVSTQRVRLGAYQNRLEHTIANLDSTSENTQAAESRIRDTDMAKMMVEYSKNNILEQAAQTMLSQANQSAQSVLSLLQ